MGSCVSQTSPLDVPLCRANCLSHARLGLVCAQWPWLLEDWTGSHKGPQGAWGGICASVKSGHSAAPRPAQGTTTVVYQKACLESNPKAPWVPAVDWDL